MIMDKEVEGSEGSSRGHAGDPITSSPGANFIEISNMNVEVEPTVNFSNDSVLSRINEEISYPDFFRQFLLRNCPCIVSNFISNDWESRKLWRKGPTPDWASLKKSFGEFSYLRNIHIFLFNFGTLILIK